MQGVWRGMLAALGLAAGLGAPAAAQPQCGGLIQPACLESLGAGAAVLPESSCAEQLARYRNCIAGAAKAAGAAPSGPVAACSESRAQSLWSDAKAAGSCIAYQAFRRACPDTPEALFAEGAMEQLGCGGAAAAPAPADPVDPAGAAAQADAAAAERAEQARLHRAIQAELKRLGDYQSAVDGLWGPGSERALRAFQRRAGLAADGAPSEALLSRLRAAEPPAHNDDLSDLGDDVADAFARKDWSRLTQLGYDFREGDGGKPQDDAAALRLYRAACEGGGDALGCTNLGFMYRKGFGVKQDDARAAALHRQGCDGGSALGCTNLGFMYRYGYGVKQDDARAVALYRQGCDGGEARGCTNLGFMYRKGFGVKQDDARAAALYRQGCDGGEALGCTNLGFMYENGKGVAPDDARAAELYRMGCDQEAARGCNNLGVMYEKGKGVAQDRSRAIASYRQALKLDPDYQPPKRNLKRLGETP